LEEKCECFTIKIEDDFDLAKIADCGQCFRVRVINDNMYRFITGHHIIYIKKLQEGRYSVCCGKNTWEGIWVRYFDLSRNYQGIREQAWGKNAVVDRAMEAGIGLRVLRQDAWEMLITFIISQRKNIPAIAKAVENLSMNFGKKLVTPYEAVHAFPTPEELCKTSDRELSSCGLGYRMAYVRDAAEKVMSGTLDLSGIARYSDEDLYAELLTVRGVGKKVANCVCLFGYGRTARVPIDVWIARAIQEECQGNSPFGSFGEEAGIIQQYLFYYERNYKTTRSGFTQNNSQTAAPVST